MISAAVELPAASTAVTEYTPEFAPDSKSLTAEAAPRAVMVITPALEMEKKPSALVEVPLAVKLKPVTATLSKETTVATVAPATWFSA